jgi:diketogulonate reductase-like aldo/keto reductase
VLICLEHGTKRQPSCCNAFQPRSLYLVTHSCLLVSHSRVGFIKIKSVCTLVDGDTHHEHNLPGICFLRGNAVSIFVALHCIETGSVYSLLVDQPRIPIGQVSCLEVPAGMMDDEKETVAGIAVKEMEEECGIVVRPSDLTDLTELACQEALQSGSIPMAGIPPSPGGCDEFVRCMYLEKKVTVTELEEMRGRLQGLREHGEYITLKVVPMEDVWKISGDAKAMISLFLLDQLRREGKLPPAGELATPLVRAEPVLKLNTDAAVQQLAFGLYKIPATDEGVQVISDAIAAGYRHFDGASVYGNEVQLGQALRKSGIPREAFFITSKVWNDAVKDGRAAVRKSVEKSLSDVDYGDYFDAFLVHWPVPGCFVPAYKELEEMHKEGTLRAIGLSNFSIEEYTELAESGITVPPAMNQMEVSPVMYRKDLIDYFQSQNIVVTAYKPLNRAASFGRPEIVDLAAKYAVSPAQIMLRWGLQKSLVILAKTSTASRMPQNRAIMHFTLKDEDMAILDALTTEDDIRARREHELMRKTSL